MSKYLYLSFVALLMMVVSLVSFKFGSKTKDVVPNKILSPSPYSAPTKTSLSPSEIGVWIAYWDEIPSIVSLRAASKEIKTISPVWYRLESDGTLIGTKYSKWQDIMDIATSSGMVVMPTINNEFDGGFDPVRVSKILNDEYLSNNLINQLVEVASEKKYQGWDIDWEQIKASDKDAFTGFIKKLSEQFHGKGLRLSVTVHAQTGDSNEWLGTRGQDLSGLSIFADEIRIMAYDFHYSNSAPGPITPLSSLEAVLKYTSEKVPQNKLVLGLPLYGYDWVGEKGESVQYEEAKSLLKLYSSVEERDDASKELKAKYTVNGIEHEVWFQDSESVGQKILLARKYGVYKFFFWRLGKEDPLVWTSYDKYK